MKEKIIIKRKETSISGKAGKITSIRKKNISKTGCRIYQDNKIGIAGGLGLVDENSLFLKAQEALKYQIPYEVEPTSKLEKTVKLDAHPISDEDMLSETEVVLQYLSKNYGDFISTPNIVYQSVSKELSNDLGLKLLYEDAFYDFSMMFKHKNSSGIIDTYVSCRDRKFSSDSILTVSKEMLDAFSNSIEMPSKEIPIIIDQETINQIFNNDLNGKLIGKNSSLFAESIGKKLFNSQVSLRIKTDPVEAYKSPFDNEGTITNDEDAYLIKDGTILRPYCDKRTSLKYGFTNTGCAGGGYDGVPSLAPRPLEILPSNKTLKELLDGQMGIYICIASGGDFTPDGVYASPVQASFLHNGDKIIGKLPEFSIKASIFDILGSNFIGVSKDKQLLAGNSNVLVTRMKVAKLF